MTGCGWCLIRVSPWSLERLRAVKGFAPDEMEPRTSDGEVVADLLASAGAAVLPVHQLSRALAAGRACSASPCLLCPHLPMPAMGHPRQVPATAGFLAA